MSGRLGMPLWLCCLCLRIYARIGLGLGLIGVCSAVCVACSSLSVVACVVVVVVFGMVGRVDRGLCAVVVVGG